MSFILKRIREPSTWAGIIAIAAGLFGFKLDPEQQQAAIQLGLAIAGVLFVFTREQTKVGEQITEAVESVTHPAPVSVNTETRTATRVPGTTPANTVGIKVPLPPTRGLQGRINRNK